MKLQDRTLLITGGTSGIGYALVRQLAPVNRSIIVIASNAEKLRRLGEEFSNVRTYCCSLEDASALQRTVSEIIHAHPDMSVVINNAGIQVTPKLLDDDFDYDSIEKEISINLAAPIKICALVVHPLLNLKKPAAIVNVTSGLAIYPKIQSAVYCATKAGLRNFTRSFRYQLEQTQINVIEAILPLVDTPMTYGRGNGKMSPERAARAIICGVENNRAEIYVGKAKLIPLVARISPRLMAAILKSG